ncbi:MAG: glutathione ABC transporter permease GsiC, partial [Gammaproteobacteria bacterium]
MLRYILARLLAALLVMLGVASLVFLLLHLVPGDPVDVMLGKAATVADRSALRRQLGLDAPLWWQWISYLRH